MYIGSYPAAVPLNEAQLAVGDKRFFKLDNSNIPVLSFRNKLINGLGNGVAIAQRFGLAGVTINANSWNIVADRWYVFNDTDKPLTTQVLPAGIGEVEPRLALWSNTAPTTGTVSLAQRIEGVTTLASKAAVLSYEVYSADANSFTSYLTQNFGTGGSPSAGVQYNSTTGNTAPAIGAWQRIVNAFPAIPSTVGKSLGTNANSYLQVAIQYTPRTAGIVHFRRLQLEEAQAGLNLNPTPFEARDWTTEARLCERYYQKLGYDLNFAPGDAQSGYMVSAASWGTSSVSATIPMRTEMRSTPSSIINRGNQLVATGGTVGIPHVLSGGAWLYCDNASIAPGTNYVAVSVTRSAGGFTVNGAVLIGGAYLLSAEL